MSGIPYGDPYRAPCGGWKTRQISFGGPYQHWRGAESAVPLYANAFTPPTVPDGPATECEGGTLIHGNCYTLGETTGNFAACRKTGWKGVRAHKNWHGRFGFTDCVGEGQCDRRTTKFLQIRREATFYWYEDGFGVHNDDSAVREWAVGRNTGVVSEVTCTGDTPTDAIYGQFLSGGWACGPIWMDGLS